MSTSNLFADAVRITRGAIPDLLLKKGNRNGLIRKRKTHRTGNTVGSLLESVRDIPPRTLLLGKCSDGLPFLMELGAPELGAVLIGCDAGCGKTHQLQVMVDSAMRINPPNKVQVVVLSPNPDEWKSLQSDNKSKQYLRDILSWYAGKSEMIIEELTELAEDRRQGKRWGADVLLILDDLKYVEDLGYEAQVNLHWLLEYGSQSGVWVISTVDADLADNFHYWIDTFRTRIIGRTGSPEDAAVIAMRPNSKAFELEHGSFQVWTGSQWLTYQLVPLGD